MDGWNERLEVWVREHPWSWGAWGSLVMGGIVLSLQLLVDRHPLEQALPLCTVVVGVWFVLLGVTAKRRARD
jgi:uncharacterized membrane protein HdeD (DUF308 family)